ncbi:MAG TPA: preprotein translocase subunit SecG [Lacunisphaera sp.]
MSLVIGILTLVLVLTSVFLVFVVLMQRAKSDSGMGAAMGGGSMESTFGAETNNVLSTATIRAAIVFFVVSFALYLTQIYQAKHHAAAENKLPTVVAPAVKPAPVTATPAPAATKPAAQPATTTPVEPKKP